MVAKLSPAAVSDLVHFFVDDRGKRRRLFRSDRAANWQFRMEVKGKQFPRSMETPVVAIAERNALRLIRSLRSEDWEAVERMRVRSAAAAARVAVMGDVFERYLTLAETELAISKRAVRGNVSALRGIVAAGLGIDLQAVDAVSAAALSDEAVLRGFVRRKRAEGRADRSIRSQLNQGRSVVCREVRGIYRELVLPGAGLGWSEVAISWRLEDPGFVRIADDVLSEMEMAAGALRLENFRVWLVYMLMSRLGMRNSEVAAARWGWLELRRDAATGADKLVMNIRNRAEEGFEVKNSMAGCVDVPVELARVLLEVRGDKRAGDFLIEAGCDTEREVVTMREINLFVRRFLPDREKGAYELRKWAGSRVAAEFGIYEAQHFLRHRSVKTTETYYATFLREARSVSDGVGSTWAYGVV